MPRTLLTARVAPKSRRDVCTMRTKETTDFPLVEVRTHPLYSTPSSTVLFSIGWNRPHGDPANLALRLQQPDASKRVLLSVARKPISPKLVTLSLHVCVHVNHAAVFAPAVLHRPGCRSPVTPSSCRTPGFPFRASPVAVAVIGASSLRKAFPVSVCAHEQSSSRNARGPCRHRRTRTLMPRAHGAVGVQPWKSRLFADAKHLSSDPLSPPPAPLRRCRRGLG